ncbi:MAG: DUF4198 domain-containing protein [Proteobacteria bacterium]|nr:DUF4198 domain-containing protein [Pseudomonadota bacterium]
MNPIILNNMRACALLLAGTGAVQAHDFWVQPVNYRVAPEALLPITLQVGHGPYRQRSPLPMRRITRFAAIAPNAQNVDLRSRLHLGEPADDGSLQLQQPGTYVVVLETDNQAQSHLPSIRFNDYLHAEGLTAVLAQRERTHKMDADGSESYSRHSKALVQVRAPRAESSSLVTQPVGMTLEIVPDIDPYATPRPTSLPVHVLFEGKPLTGALIKLTNLEHDAQPVETHRTDADGRSRFAMPDQGRWLLNVIWSQPLPQTRETDFETWFSSLSFGL